MATRRMFSRELCKSDKFLDMPVSARELYFQLGLDADDDGFVSSPRTIQRSIGSSPDDLTTLAAKGYIIPFESGVVVITHWRQYNSIRKDRYQATRFVAEMGMLTQDESHVYLLEQPMAPDGCQVVANMGAQYRLVESSLVESKDTLSGKPDPMDGEAVERIIEHLNETTGKRYKATTPKTRSLIASRMSEGFSESDFMAVIDHKVAKWRGDPKMDEYLRPSTLFSASKFEGYLNEEGVTDDGADEYAISDYVEL